MTYNNPLIQNINTYQDKKPSKVPLHPSIKHKYKSAPKIKPIVLHNFIEN